MTHAAIAGAAMSAVRGSQDAQDLLHRLHGGCAPLDALMQDLLEVHAVGDAERFRSFCRELQQVLERAA